MSYYISEVRYTDKNDKDYISKVKVSNSLNSHVTDIWTVSVK